MYHNIIIFVYLFWAWDTLFLKYAISCQGSCQTLRGKDGEQMETSAVKIMSHVRRADGT